MMSSCKCPIGQTHSLLAPYFKHEIQREASWLMKMQSILVKLNPAKLVTVIQEVLSSQVQPFYGAIACTSSSLPLMG